MNGPEEQRVVRADGAFRKRALLLLLVAALLGVAVIIGAQSYLGYLKKLSAERPHLAAEKAATVLKLTSLAMAAALFASGVYTLSLWRRVRASGLFPPPGLRVLRDTRVVAGARARRLALAIMVLAIFLFVGGMLIPLLTFSLADALRRGATGARATTEIGRS